MGIASSYDPHAQRWEVEILDDDSKKEHVRCKRDNLIFSQAVVAANEDSAVSIAGTSDSCSVGVATGPKKITILCGGDVRNAEPLVVEVIDVPRRPVKQDTP